jgi:hypothetical protein
MVEEDLPDPDAGTGQLPGIRYHLDLDTGDVWESSDDRVWEKVGTIPGTATGGDGLPPSKVENVIVVPIVEYGPDGETIERVGLGITWDPSPEGDVVGYEIHVDAYDGLFTVYASLWSGGPATTYIPAIVGHQYYVRVRAYDSEGLVGEWSDTATATTLDDGTAPAIPSDGDVDMIPGYKLVAVQWPIGGESDLDHYEVQWTDEIYVPAVPPTDPPVPTGNPNLDNTQVVTTDGSSVIIAGLGVGLKYFARVRAVDTGGWVAASAVDPTPVQAESNPDAGWSSWVSETTLLVGSSDLAVHALAAEFINAGILDANRVNTGVLTIGKTTAPAGRKPTGIVVYDSLARFIGWWDQTGMLMVNPSSPKQAMWLNAGMLQFTSNLRGYEDAALPENQPPYPPLPSVLNPPTVWATAVSPEGINAEAITFGSAQAGHNLLPNSGFELQAFSGTAEATPATFTTSADWTAGTGKINLDTSTGDLKLTAL